MRLVRVSDIVINIIRLMTTLMISGRISISTGFRKYIQKFRHIYRYHECLIVETIQFLNN